MRKSQGSIQSYKLTKDNFFSRVGDSEDGIVKTGAATNVLRYYFIPVFFILLDEESSKSNDSILIFSFNSNFDAESRLGLESSSSLICLVHLSIKEIAFS